MQIRKLTTITMHEMELIGTLGEQQTFAISNFLITRSHMFVNGVPYASPRPLFFKLISMVVISFIKDQASRSICFSLLRHAQFSLIRPSGQERNGRNGREWTFCCQKSRACLHDVTRCHTMSRKIRNVKGFDR